MSCTIHRSKMTKLFHKPGDGFVCHLTSKAPVIRRRCPTLLCMPKFVVADRKVIFSFLCVHPIMGSGHKFERTKVRIAEKVELLSARTFVLATTSDKFLYSVKCLSWPEYMYDVPLSPVYNSPHQVVRYQVTQSSVLLLWPWLPPPPPHGFREQVVQVYHSWVRHGNHLSTALFN